MRNQEKYIYRIYIEGHTYKNFKIKKKKIHKTFVKNVCTLKGKHSTQLSIYSVLIKVCIRTHFDHRTDFRL